MSIILNLVDQTVKKAGLFTKVKGLARQGNNLFVRIGLTSAGKAVFQNGLDDAFLPQDMVEIAIERIEESLGAADKDLSGNIDLGIFRQALEHFPDYIMAKRLEGEGYLKSEGSWEYHEERGRFAVTFEISHAYATELRLPPEKEYRKYFVTMDMQDLINLIADIGRVLRARGKEPKENLDYAIATKTLEGYCLAKRAEYDDAPDSSEENRLEP